ncbi:MAG: alpha/beta fold hydrolase [Parachlamydiaceae bacterium]
MANRRALIALPGFLGLKNDWDLFKAKHFGVHTFISESLFCKPSLNEFAQAFNIKMEENPFSSRVLMGYSLGGRLALHILLQAPHLWDKAVIISAHPGLNTLGEKEQRIASDTIWAHKFLHNPWEDLLAEWNTQAIFQGFLPCLTKREEEFSRSNLAHFLTHYSLGYQEDLRESIARLPCSILWITGELDQKFSSLASDLRFTHPKSRVLRLGNAGHRVPWEQPEAFQKEVYSFLKED